MSPELKRRIQLVLVIAIGLAALRSGYILYQRHSEKLAEKAKHNVPLNADHYVTPKKLYPYDLKSARQLIQQPVWVKEGYRYTYYPYASGHLDLTHPAGLFLPIEKVQFKDVVLAPSPAAHEKLMVALFEKDHQTLGVQIGSVAGDNYQIYSDEQFYIQDPRELYKHWPSDVWDAIEQRQMKAGMSEMQANFAIGMGVPERSDDPATKTVSYPNGGNPLVVTYHDGRAAVIKPGHPQG